MKQTFTETQCPVCHNDFAYQPDEIIIECETKYVVCPICGEHVVIQ